MELREKIAELVAERMFGCDVRAKRQYEVADAILAIPEIRDALSLVADHARMRKALGEISAIADDAR